MSRSAVIDRLRRRIGLDPESIGETTLTHAIDEACATLECADCQTLLARIDSDEREWQRFVDCMVVPETWLFRSPEQFEDLVRFARERAASRTPLRILSLPCATGEEAYSIAASLLASGLSPNAFEVLGIDVSQRAIALARAARYRNSAARGRPLDPAWFQRDGDNWVPTAAVARCVRFRSGNLLAPGCFQPGERFDVVFFRNLMIYLDADARRQALAQILGVLDEPGLVLAGQAENLCAIDARLQPLAGYGPLTFSRTLRTPVATLPRPSESPPQAARATAAAPTSPRPQIDNPTPPVDLLPAAQQAADLGEFERARALCLQLLASQPESAPGWRLRGLIAMGENDLLEADQAFARASYLDAGDSESVQYRAALAERLGRPHDAAQLRSRLARIHAQEGRQ